MKTVSIFDKIEVDCISKDEIMDWAVDVLNDNISGNYILCINLFCRHEYIQLYYYNHLFSHKIIHTNYRYYLHTNCLSIY